MAGDLGQIWVGRLEWVGRVEEKGWDWESRRTLEGQWKQCRNRENRWELGRMGAAAGRDLGGT